MTRAKVKYLRDLYAFLNYIERIKEKEYIPWLRKKIQFDARARNLALLAGEYQVALGNNGVTPTITVTLLENFDVA